MSSVGFAAPNPDQRRRRLRRVFLVMTVVSAAILVALGVGNWYFSSKLTALQTYPKVVVSGVTLPAPKGRGALAKKPPTGQPFTVLILGTDSRAGTTAYGPSSAACGCSDTIILARVNPQTAKVSLLSVPRDSRVNVVGGNDNPTKINSAFARGPDNSVATIEAALQIPINHWVVLDLAGFKSIVDAIGGIRLDFPIPVFDKNAGLFITTTGCQQVSGETALAVSRSRELKYLTPAGTYVFDPTYEYGRARREQILMKVIAAHTAKESLSNPLTAIKVIDTFTSHQRLQVDNQLSKSELLTLATDFAGFNAAGMQTFTLPTVTESLYDRGAGKNLDFEILQPTADIATIQAWYNAVQPTPQNESTPTTAPTTTGPAAAPTLAPTNTRTTTATGHPTATGPDSTVPTAATTPTAAANQPRAWDPIPCP